MKNFKLKNNNNYNLIIQIYKMILMMNIEMKINLKIQNSNILEMKTQIKIIEPILEQLKIKKYIQDNKL